MTERDECKIFTFSGHMLALLTCMYSVKLSVKVVSFISGDLDLTCLTIVMTRVRAGLETDILLTVSEVIQTFCSILS